MSCALVCALLAGMALAADDDAPTTKLKWGDPAPPLAIQEFVQGEPVEQFESGKVYVVEFWATWCGPCLESIPHLSKLQKEHPDVVFLGVSIDEERILVPPFVKKMRGKMTYRVAIEAHLEDDHAGAMSLGWLAAADASVIPTAFIVDGEGRVAWIGHPDELEEPLEEIVAGEWDIASAWSEREEELVQAKRAVEASAGLYIALARRDFAKALTIVETQIEVDPDAEDEQGTLKFWILKQLGDRQAAAEYGQHLLSATDMYDVDRLTEIAGIVACPEEYGIGDYGGMDVDDGMNFEDMADENEDADADDDDSAEEPDVSATDESAEKNKAADAEKASDETAEKTNAKPVGDPDGGDENRQDRADDSDEDDPTEENHADDDNPADDYNPDDDDTTAGMEAEATDNEPTDNEPTDNEVFDVENIDDPLLQIAIIAGHRAVSAAAELDMVDEQAAAARVLAKAYALAGHPAHGREVVNTAVEALEESIGRRQALIEQLKETLAGTE